MVVVVTVRMAVRRAVAVGARLGFERRQCLGDLEVHAPQHVGEHRIGFELQAVGAYFELDVAVAEVIGGARQVCRGAVLGAGADLQHRLRRGLHPHQRAVVGDEHVAAAHHGAARQEYGQATPGIVLRLEAALAAHVPVKGHDRGAPDHRGGQSAAAGEELVDGEHESGLCGAERRASITNVITEFEMNASLKLTQIGNSVGIILPKEVLARLKLEKGDSLFITEAASGGLTLTPYDPAVEEQVDLGREFMREYRDTFRQLAK